MVAVQMAFKWFHLLQEIEHLHLLNKFCHYISVSTVLIVKTIINFIFLFSETNVPFIYRKRSQLLTMVWMRMYDVFASKCCILMLKKKLPHFCQRITVYDFVRNLYKSLQISAVYSSFWMFMHATCSKECNFNFVNVK